MKKWGWLVQYGVTIVLALGLGFLLSQVQLFHETTLGSAKVRASHLVHFLGVGGALVVLWKFGQRLINELPTQCPQMSFLCPVIMPFTTLIIMMASHPIGGQVFGPFLGKTGKGIYNWIFVIGMVSAALWLVHSWFTKAAPSLQSCEKNTESSSRGSAEVASASINPRYRRNRRNIELASQGSESKA